MVAKRKTLSLNFKSDSDVKDGKDVKDINVVKGKDDIKAQCEPKKATDEKSKSNKKNRKGKNLKNKKKEKVVRRGPTPSKSQEQRIAEVTQMLDILCDKFPKCFNEKDRKPLKIGVLKDLFVALSEEEFSKRAIRRALSFYVWRIGYLKTLLAQDHRYDLKGEVSGDVTAQQKQMAKKHIDMLKQRQAKKAEENKQLRAKVQASGQKGKISRDWQS